MIKLTFKADPKPTGLARVGCGDYVHVKIKGKKMGIISGGSAYNKGYSIQLAIKTEAHPGWGWKFLNRDCKTLDEAKNTAQAYIDAFAAKYTIHYFEG